MAYTYTIHEKESFLKVVVKGHWSPGSEMKDAAGILLSVAEVCNEKGITRILIVWDVSGHMPTMEGYRLVTSDEFTWDRRLRLANVHPHEERFQDNLFTETVAVNRGYQVRMFRDEKEAEAWLLRS